MNFNYQNLGKLESGLVKTVTGNLTTTNHLYITDRASKIQFLTDSGEKVSVMPSTVKEKQQSNNEFKLYAANNSCIGTYVNKTITLNLRLRLSYFWGFVVAYCN